MGSYNLTGCISRTSIKWGDRVAVLLCRYDPNSRPIYGCDMLTPIALPIYGVYDDYGNVEDVVEDDNVKWLKEHIGDIHDIVTAFNECDIYSPTIQDLLDASPDETLESIYENLLSGGHYPAVTKDTRLCVVFEHEDLFKKWIADYNGLPEKYLFKNTLAEFLKKDLAKKSIEVHPQDSLAKAFFECNIFQLVSDTFLSVNGQIGILGVYKQKGDIDFIINYADEITDLQKFMGFVNHMHFTFGPTCSGYQWTDHKEQIKYYRACIKFLQEKIKEEEDC